MGVKDRRTRTRGTGSNYFAFSSADAAGAGIQCPTTGTVPLKQHRQARGSWDTSARRPGGFKWRDLVGAATCPEHSSQLPEAQQEGHKHCTCKGCAGRVGAPT